jgi:hypothetical protein
MDVAMITLSDAERRALNQVAADTGQSLEALVHEGVEMVIARHSKEGRLTLMRQARGIWAHREDLPDLRRLRGEWEPDPAE